MSDQEFPTGAQVVRDRGGVLGEIPGDVVGHERGEVLVVWDGQDAPVPYHPSLLALHTEPEREGR